MHLHCDRSALLALPIELREIILDRILASAFSIDLSTSLPCSPNDAVARDALQAFSALSLTCKQINEEATSVFLVRNTFKILANRNLPSIPDPYLQRMRSVTLYRTLIGKEFRLNISTLPGQNRQSSIEVVECSQDQRPAEGTLAAQAVEQMIVLRLTAGAKAAFKMLEQVVEDGRLIALKDLEDVASRLNRFWLIAM